MHKHFFSGIKLPNSFASLSSLHSYDTCSFVISLSDVILSELFCVVLCTEAVHSHKHTLMSSYYSSLDWVLSHWAHFTVRRLIYVYLCVFCVFLFHTTYVLYYSEHG